jgi:hypothetical protein
METPSAPPAPPGLGVEVQLSSFSTHTHKTVPTGGPSNGQLELKPQHGPQLDETSNPRYVALVADGSVLGPLTAA